MTTRASDLNPTRRIVLDRDGNELILEVRAMSLTLRPKGTRKGGPAEVVLAPGRLYIQAMTAQAGLQRPRRRR